MTMYTDNADKWRTLSDIDYFTYFVKSWISFNAWYKNTYPELKTDRNAIDQIKEDDRCAFKKRFLSLLNGNNEESGQFKANFAALHYSLINNTIKYKGQRLYFEKFMIEIDKNNLKQNEKHNNISYQVEITMNKNNREIDKVEAIIKGKKVNLNYSCNKYDLSNLESDKDFIKLSDTQKRKIKGLLQEANPYKETELLAKPNDHNSLKIGSYTFINESEKIYKVAVEIIYCLRNALFHGEIIPNKNSNTVYEAAYRMMRQLVSEI